MRLDRLTTVYFQCPFSEFFFFPVRLEALQTTSKYLSPLHYKSNILLEKCGKFHHIKIDLASVESVVNVLFVAEKVHVLHVIVDTDP